MEDSRYRIVPGMVEGVRCWGCCQENCQRCSCSCHQPVNGWKLVKGTRVVWTSEHKQELVLLAALVYAGAIIIEKFKNKDDGD